MPPLPTRNDRLILQTRPKRGPVTNDTFKRDPIPIPSLRPGELLVQVDYIGIDATMRNWLNDTRSYIKPVGIGEVMRASGIGRVVSSEADGFSEGDLVTGALGWQEYWTGPAKWVQRVHTPPGGREMDHLGLYGTAGMTAYFGIFDVGRLKDGDTVVVSGAAGSVGIIVVQIALSHPKCKVIAIAGSSFKCGKLREMGCHTVLNYKDSGFKKALKSVGLVDVYFDNVGGEILDQILTQLNDHARIVLCGAISQYNAQTPHPLKNTLALISTKSSMTGYIIFDYLHRYPEAQSYLSQMVSKGLLKYEYTVLQPKSGEGNGLGRCVEGMGVLYAGENFGKTLVRISPVGSGSDTLETGIEGGKGRGRESKL